MQNDKRGCGYADKFRGEPNFIRDRSRSRYWKETDVTKKSKNNRSSEACNRPDCRTKLKALARLTKTGIGKPPKQRYFDEKWLAVRLGVATKTIQKMRYAKIGPQPIPIGGCVRYYIRDILAYERSLRDPRQT